MRYEVIRSDSNALSYRVTEEKQAVAAFTCSLFSDREESFREHGQFWIRELTLLPQFEDYEHLYAILKFIQYKCWCAGMPAIYLRLSSRNLFYLELYRKYGFRVIAQETREGTDPALSCDCVLKWVLPQTRHELYSHYIRQKA